MNCSKHGYYLNVNGCADCNQWKVEEMERLIRLMPKRLTKLTEEEITARNIRRNAARAAHLLLGTKR